jgi:site-specific recombinase XerD
MTWEISYRFTDGNLKKTMQKRITVPKKLNYPQRKLFIEQTVKDIREKIIEQGFNPFTNECINPEAVVLQQNGTSNKIDLRQAFEKVFERLKDDTRTKSDIKSMLNYIYPAMEQLNYASLPVDKITRDHIENILEACGKIKVNTIIPIDKKGKTKRGIWTSYTYNHYRGYLSKLFSDIEKKRWIDDNPVRKIEKEKQVKRIRKELSKDERMRVLEHLSKNHPEFCRFVIIFHANGSRIIETLRVKKEDVDLEKWRFKVLVKKGRGDHHEQWRTICSYVEKEWEYLYKLAKPGEYIFAEGLLPGTREKPIRRDQITRRWRDHVKDKLDIEADIYSLKHSNLDEIADQMIVLQEATTLSQIAAGHASPVVTMEHYLKGHKQREHELLRKINNKFA